MFYKLEDKTRRPPDYQPPETMASSSSSAAGTGGSASAVTGRGKRPILQIIKEETSDGNNEDEDER